jgi:cellulose synthase/poly-beta-1,6-N-acetylglucosamine synthase-like glycosyltransferase
MMSPSVSVVVPAYNSSGTIVGCIESLLAVAYPKDKLEIIIVDNNSTDDTRSLIQQYSVIFESENEVQSSYAARNKGLKRAQGDIIAFTDSDCFVEPEWIAKGVKHFEDHRCGAVGGEVLSSPPSSVIEEYLVSIDFLHQRHCLENSFYPYIQTANAFYRRSIFHKVGLFDPMMISGGDADLCWRMQMQTSYRICYADKARVYHRHRNTLKGLYTQRRIQGMGRILLETKYEKQMKDKGLLLRKDESLIAFLKRFFVHGGYVFLKPALEILQLRPRRSLDGFFCFVGFLGEYMGQMAALREIGQKIESP